MAEHQRISAGLNPEVGPITVKVVETMRPTELEIVTAQRDMLAKQACHERIGVRISTLVKYGAPGLVTDEVRRVVAEERENYALVDPIEGVGCNCPNPCFVSGAPHTPMNETNVSKMSEFPEDGNIPETAIPPHKTVYKRSTDEIEEGLSSAREALAGGDDAIAGLLMAPDELYEALNDVLHDWITCADPVARQAQLRRVLMEDNAYPSDSLARTLLRVRQEDQ